MFFTIDSTISLVYDFLKNLGGRKMPETHRLRTKMTPITITANRLHLHNIRLWDHHDNKPPTALADLLIGNSLLITDIAFIRDQKKQAGVTLE